MLIKIRKKISEIIYSPIITAQITNEAIFEDWYNKYKDYTMISNETFKGNLTVCEKAIHVHGSIVECGVWRGGMMAAMAELFGNEREYFLFDSFEGLPEVKEIDGVRAKMWQENKEAPNYYDNCKAEIEYAYKAMELSKSEKTTFIKGWFSKTLSQYDVKKSIAVLRLDCDWYDSVMQCLDVLFPLVAKGGIIIIDDYFAWDGCSIALHDYLSKYKLPNRINTVENKFAYIIK